MWSLAGMQGVIGWLAAKGAWLGPVQTRCAGSVGAGHLRLEAPPRSRMATLRALEQSLGRLRGPAQDAYLADSFAAFMTSQADDGMEDEMTFSERSRFVRFKGGTWLYANGEVTTDTPGLAGAILNK